MKRLFLFLMIAGVAILLNACGLNNAYLLNQNQNSTQVHLTGNNFRIVDKVSGDASVDYVLIFGGMNRTRLYEQAYANMIREAGLDSGARAVVNVLLEFYFYSPPF